MNAGTDDDLRPSHNNRVPRGGGAAVNGRPLVGSVSCHMVHSDMESQIHHLEKEAYGSVLLAFKAQSDTLTWEKEGLMTELREELSVSDDEHRELLTRVNANYVLCQIRDWRQVGGHSGSIVSTPQPGHDLIRNPTVSALHMKQRTPQSVPLSFGMASQPLQPQSIAVSTQPSFSAVKGVPALGARGKKSKHDQPLPGLSSMKSMSFPTTAPTGRDQFTNRSSYGVVGTKEPAQAATRDPLIGRKVMKRWPNDDNFYEAVVKDSNFDKEVRTLFSEIYGVNKAGKRVDLEEIPCKDIQRKGEDLRMSQRGDRSGQGCGFSNSMSRGVVCGAASGRRSTEDQFENEFPESQNGVGRNSSYDFEILHTETLINELAERVFGASQPDLLEIGKAKKMLKEHENALIDVIAKLADASDSGRDEEQPFPNGQSFNIEQ